MINSHIRNRNMVYVEATLLRLLLESVEQTCSTRSCSQLYLAVMAKSVRSKSKKAFRNIKK